MQSDLPTGQVRSVGSQRVTEVIWEGRNHALHWESGSPRPAVSDMLDKLDQEELAKIADKNKNNAYAILEALGWTDAEEVISELRNLV